MTSKRNLAAAACACLLVALGPVSTADSQPATVALWHMDDPAGGPMTDAAGSNTGTLNAVTTGLPGVSGTAFGFNGSSSYVSVPSSPALSPGTAPMQFSMSVLLPNAPPKGSTQDFDLLRKGVASTSGGMYKLEVRHSGSAVCRFAGSAGDVLVVSQMSVADGRWHTITCGRTTAGVSVTVDGVTRSVAGATGAIVNTSRLVIGAKPGSDYTRGTLDEASITVG